MLETFIEIAVVVVDIVLYIPRRILLHFENYNNNKEELKKQDEILTEYKKRFKAIRYECDNAKTINWCGNISIPMDKIKELASPED